MSAGMGNSDFGSVGGMNNGSSGMGNGSMGNSGSMLGGSSSGNFDMAQDMNMKGK